MRLNELSTKSPEEIIVRAIKKDCEPYLIAVDYYPASHIMWRGLRYDTGKPIAVADCPFNREPRDTGEMLHKLADSFFMRQFGVRYRSEAIFVTGSREEAGMYGSEMDGYDYMFMPRGTFKFCWSEKIMDFYSDFENDLSGIEIEDDRQLRKAELNLLKSANYRTDNLKAAINSGHEIMMHCNNGYLIQAEYFKLIADTEWKAL